MKERMQEKKDIKLKENKLKCITMLITKFYHKNKALICPFKHKQNDDR